MIKGVIFDLDGTILNTIDDLVAAMNRMLVSFGYPPREDMDFQKQAIGYGARNYVKKCMPASEQENDAQIDKCLAAYYEDYRANSSVKTKPYEDINAVLTFLKSHRIKIGVLSNKPDGATKALVKKWFGAYDFDCVYGERENVPPKPHKGAPLSIAKEMGLTPSEIAFVGDSEVDMQTGVAAGMIPLGVLWGFRTKEQLLSGGAQFLAVTPKDLITIIEEYNQ
ncbi:MAG: HAD family hydrolase [Clostridia bacterium]|nr:HAD family hydrolase [Clostridia bacterium]